MIIVDISHLSYRNLYTTIFNAKPKEVKETGKYKTEDWFPMYVHQMLFSLSKIEKEYGHYGKIILALDSKNNWRKEYLEESGYKGTRKKSRDESEINFEEFFEENDKFIDFLINGLGYVSVKVDKVEADDIGYVLSEYINEETLLITEDKDWKQHLINNYNVHIYMPLKNQLLKNNKNIQDELKMFRAVHICIGDKADDIPNIMLDVEYSKEFLTFLNEKGIFTSLPSELEVKEFWNELKEEALSKDIEIYKKQRFGEKTAEKFIKNPTEFIRKKIKDKKRLYDNLRRNRLLVDIKKLPNELKEKVIDTYNSSLSQKINENLINNYLNKYNLNQARNLRLNGFELSNLPDEFTTKSFNDIFSF